jgi:hypothetical protein
LIEADFSSSMIIKLARDPNFIDPVIIIKVKDVNFRKPDFTPSKALIVIDEIIKDTKDNMIIKPEEIMTFKLLSGIDATKKYGEKGKDGAVEILSYDAKNSSNFVSDSTKYRTLININHVLNKGELIDLPVSNIKSIRIWTYETLDDLNKKESRYITIMTRYYYIVKGNVVNEKGKPLSGVKITATDNPAIEISDKNGHFEIGDVREGALLEFSLPRYKSYYLNTLYEVAYNIDLTIPLQNEKYFENEIYELVDKMPQYPGGEGALREF